MALNYSPTLYHSGSSTSFVLPMPIKINSITTTFKGSRHSVPKSPKAETYANHKEGKRISISGGVGVQSGTQKIEEGEMFVAMKDLDVFLNKNKDSPLEYRIWYDSVSNKWHKLTEVYVENFTIELGDDVQREFAYVLELHCNDPEYKFA